MLDPLVSMLLPSSALSLAATKAVLVSLLEQCVSISATEPAASGQDVAVFPLSFISDSLINASASHHHLFPSIARILLCFSRMQIHPEHPALIQRLVDPKQSFTTSTAMQHLRQAARSLSVSPTPANISDGGSCSLVDAESMDDAQAAAADVVSLLLLRVERWHDVGDPSKISILNSSLVDIFADSRLLLDLTPVLHPAAAPDIIALIATSCVIAADRSLLVADSSHFEYFSTRGWLRMMGSLPQLDAAQQSHVLSCAVSVMQVSAAARTVFREDGTSVVSAIVDVMTDETNAQADAGASAARVLPFICSDHLSTPVNVSGIPTLFPAARAVIHSASTCLPLTPAASSTLESVIEFLHSCRYVVLLLLIEAHCHDVCAASYRRMQRTSITAAATPPLFLLSHFFTAKASPTPSSSSCCKR
jgi:hypothetical protein